MEEQKYMCLFCGKDHKRKPPKLCIAKGEVIRNYVAAGNELWQVFFAIRNREIDLEAEAFQLLRSQTSPC